MSVHKHNNVEPLATGERTLLGASVPRWFTAAAVAGAAGLGLALVLGVTGAGVRRFYFAYLVAFSFFLSIGLGALVFVLLQHLTKAGWSVTVRRPAESLAATLPALGLLSLPILASVAVEKGDLYRWALPRPAHVKVTEAGGPERIAKVEKTAGAAPTPHAALDEAAEAPRLDALTLKKRAYLNPAFFIARVVAYFAVWSVLATWYRRQSTLQDQTGDPALTERMQRRAPVALIITAVTVTLAAFDLLMSLDPHWYSTIFGVYFFAGSAVASFAALIVLVSLLQRLGFLRHSITAEHYHDLGKFLFGFVFFWGYIAFSQYMLLWYANIPEETIWLVRHGATTVLHDVTGWSFVAAALLFGHLLIPFAGLLSRHVKRNQPALVFWAVWLLSFHLLDLYWVVMPEMGADLRPALIDLAALVGVGGVVVAALLRNLSGRSLRPVADPRLPEALAFQNI